MNELLKQALFPCANTDGQTQVTKNALTELRCLAVKMAELEPPKPLDDDDPYAILVSQQFLDKLIKEKYIHCFDKSCPNEQVVSFMNGLPIIVVPFIQNYKIVTNKEYKLIYKVLIDNLKSGSDAI